MMFLLNILLKLFVFNERQTKSLDYLTGGRLTFFREALQVFEEHPLVGSGHYRVDDLYLCILSDVGLIGFIPIIILLITRIVKNISAYKRYKTPFTSCVLCLTVFYFFADHYLKPIHLFGPGVCAFMFWIVCAFFRCERRASVERNRSLVKNMGWQTIYQIIATCMPLITAPYLSRILGAEKSVYFLTLILLLFFQNVWFTRK